MADFTKIEVRNLTKTAAHHRKIGSKFYSLNDQTKRLIQNEGALFK